MAVTNSNQITSTITPSINTNTTTTALNDATNQTNTSNSLITKSIVPNSNETFPSSNDIYYGMNQYNSLNPKCPFGVLSLTRDKQGIKLITDAGLILWEQYIPDHPNLKNNTERFTAEVAAAVYASDQNAFIVGLKIEARVPMYYLIAYNASTGLPIADDGLLNQTITMPWNSGLDTDESTELSLAYNSYSSLLLCYTTTKANTAKDWYRLYSFDSSNTANPFSRRDSSTYLKLSFGSAPNYMVANDYIVDIAVDQKNGLFYAMMLSSSVSTQNDKKVYVVPLNERFSTINNATGAYISNLDAQWTGKISLISPNDIYYSGNNNTCYWYGIYYYENNGRQVVYRYAIEINIANIGMPVVNNAFAVRMYDTSNVFFQFDENENAVVVSSTISGKNENLYVDYNGITGINQFTASSTVSDDYNYNVTLIKGKTNKDRVIISGIGTFSQWIVNSSSFKSFAPAPIIDLNYRSQQLTYSYAGSSYYPSQITDDILKSHSETSLSSDIANQTPIDGNGLWAMYKPKAFNDIDWDNMTISSVVRNENQGTVTFDATISYSVDGLNYSCKIPEYTLYGFKRANAQTNITLDSVDANRFNYDDAIAGANADTRKLFRETRPNDLSMEKLKLMIYEIINNKPTNFTIDNIIIDQELLYYDFSAGVIQISQIAVNKWYTNNGVLKDEELVLKNNFNITGFYCGSPTSFDKNTNFIAPNLVTANEFIKDIDNLNFYLYNHLVNAPIEFDYKTDFYYDKTIGGNIIIDNNIGTITIKELYLAKWNNQDGKLITTIDKNNPYEIVISNFISVPDATSVRNVYLEYLANIQPYEYTKEQIIDIINQIAMNCPSGFGIKNISLAAEPIFNNFEGIITVNPIFNLWYDENYNLMNTPKDMGTVVISGFKSVQPTVVLDNWEIGGYKKNASSYLLQDDLNDLKKLIAGNIDYLPTYHQDTNKNFNYLYDIIIDKSTLSTNDIKGEIYVSFGVQKYYDDTGIYHNDENFPVQTVTISGFKKTTGSTYFNSEYQLGYINFSPQKLTDNNIKDILLNYGINIPTDAKRNNISFTDLVKVPSEGLIRLKPILNYYYDDDGNPQHTSKTFGEITIKGFKKIQPTHFDDGRWILGSSNLVAQEVAQDQNQLKEFLMRKIVNAPDNFSANNISIVGNPKYNNKTGTIIVTVNLTRYYDDDGFLVSDIKSKTFTLTITGFFVADSKTSYPSDIEVNMPYTTPQEATNDINVIKNILLNNLVNIPPSFTTENIILRNNDISYSNIDGIVQITTITINYYFDQFLNIQTTATRFGSLTIKGFKKTQQTILPIDGWDVGNPKIEASEFIKNPDDVKNLIAQKIKNKPTNFDPINNIVLSGLNVQNQLGAFQVTVNLNNYYDDTGTLKTFGWIDQKIIISGFAIVKGATAFASEIKSSFDTTEASAISQLQIQEILFNALENTPVGLTPEEIIFDMNNDVVVNNIEGTITVKPSLNRWYDTNKDLNTVTKKFPSVKITDFRKINPTTINNFWKLGNSTVLADSVGEPQVKELIYNNLINLPSDFDKNTNIIINQLQPDNLKGQLTVEFIVNKFFDQNGILQTNGFNNNQPISVVITGYKTVAATIIPTSGWNIGDSSRLASEFLLEANQNYIKELVYSKILNLPYPYDYQNNIFISNVSSNNIRCELTFNVKVKGGYNQKGIIDNEGESSNLNATITISGFMQKYATTIKSLITINKKNVIASTYLNDNNALKEMIYQNRTFIFDNLPNNFSVTDIVSADINYVNNKLGAMEINLSIKNYYQPNTGNLINSNDDLLTKTIVIQGFSQNSPTIFNNNQPVKITALNKILTSDFDALQDKIEKLKQIIVYYSYLFFENIPNNFNESNILSIEISDVNNFDGTCVIKVSMNNYFLDDQHVSVATEPSDFTYTITGFKTSSKTIYNNSITLSTINATTNPVAANGVLASDVFNNANPDIASKGIVDEYYNYFLSNLPSSFSTSDIQEVKNISYNNINGELVVEVSLINYYSEKGFLELNDPLKITLTIKGFKQINATNIEVNEQKIAYLSDVLASSVTTDNVSTLIYTFRQLIFNGTLPDFSQDEFNNYFKINSLKSVNAESKLLLNFSLGIYYDNQGVLIKDNDKPLNFDLTIYGFKENANYTQIWDELYLNDYSTMLASDVIKDLNSLIDIIVAYQIKLFISAPNLTTSDVTVSNLNANNKEGTVKLTIALNKYYDHNGILIDSSSLNFQPLTQQVTIHGFSQILPTMIGATAIGSDTNIEAYIGLFDFLPSYYSKLSEEDANYQLKEIVMNALSKGQINGIKNSDLILSNFAFNRESANDDDNSLIVTFTLTNYITTNEGKVANSQEFSLTIKGFGQNKENAFSKGTLYYILIVAIVYLSLITSAAIAYTIYKFIKWRKKGL